MKKSQLLHIDTEIYSSLADNEMALVQKTAWLQTVAKPLSEQMVTHMCVTRPQWVSICHHILPHLPCYKRKVCFSKDHQWPQLNDHPTRSSSGLYVVNCLLNLNFQMTCNDPGSFIDMGPWSVVRVCLAACNNAHVGSRETTVVVAEGIHTRTQITIQYNQ